MKQVEVYILSGFLGSGKTTLLKNILMEEKERNRKAAVMMNELGSISIDSNAVGQDTPLKELLDGCICCTISDKLEAQIQSLLLDHDIDVIYIETTGAAHPIEVIDAVMSPIFADLLMMKGIITLVDGKRWLDRKLLTPQIQQLLIEQVRHADVIILNKADRLSGQEEAKLTLEIQNINPNSLCILTTFANVRLKSLPIASHQHKGKKGHTPVTVYHDMNLQTIVHTFSKPISREKFELFLQSMPDTVYRMKGYIKFTSATTPFLFQYSYGMPMMLQEPMNMPLNLVIIGENLQIEDMKKQLAELEY